jgi:hypothetical protein
MRVFSLTELFCMTRNELFVLHAETVAELSRLPDTSPARETALTMLRAIRRVLAQIRPGP